MRKLLLKLFLVAVLIQAGAGQAAAQPSPEAVGWWQSVLTAANAAIASVKGAAPAPEWDEMLKASAKLAQRASGANRRASTGDKVRGPDLLPKIPGGVRLGGPGATLEYLAKRDLSHVLSVKNFPESAAQPNNMVFERREWNRARGAKDMKMWDKIKVRFDNFGASVFGARRIILRTVAKGGVIGMLVEVPVTAVVETLHVTSGRKTPKQATGDGLLKVGGTALPGAVAAGALTMAGTTAGAPVLVPLVLVGGSAYVWISSDRVWEALDDETRAALKTRLERTLGTIGSSFYEWVEWTQSATETTKKTLQEYIYEGITTLTGRE